MDLIQRNSKKQGDVGLACAIWYLSKMGYTICLPLTDSQDYDLLVDINNSIKKVQVKTSRHKHNGKVFEVDLRVKGGNRSGTGIIKKLNKDSIDYLFVLTSDGDKYFIPSENLGGVSGIKLVERYNEFKVS